MGVVRSVQLKVKTLDIAEESQEGLQIYVMVMAQGQHVAAAYQ